MSMDAKAPSIAFTARNPKALRAIRVEDVGIAIWERSAPSGLSDLKLDGIVDVRFTVNIDELPAMLDSALDDAGHERSVARDILHNDILVLANHFTQIMQSEFVEIRLEHVTTNACKKFHTDYVTARLITTYVGQGTQWIDGDDLADCDCSDPHNIQQMQAGDVALFKGRLWSSQAPAIHRSPPIEGTGEERLMLVVNPAEPNNTVYQ